MPGFTALAIFLLPFAVSAACRDCLRACRSCDKPSTKNGSAHCPVVGSGFDCDLTSPFAYAMIPDAGESGRDCITLKCADSRSLFVRGQPQEYLACFQGQWRLPGKNEAFAESTDGAVCLQKCDVASCSTTIPAEYVKEHYTNASIAPPTLGKACASAQCSPGSLLYGGYRNISEPLQIDSGSLTCMGSGLWKDEKGRRFDFPACKKSCNCDQSVLMAACRTNNDGTPLLGKPLCDKYGPLPLCTGGETLYFCDSPALGLPIAQEDVHSAVIECVGAEWRMKWKDSILDKNFDRPFLGGRCLA